MPILRILSSNIMLPKYYRRAKLSEVNELNPYICSGYPRNHIERNIQCLLDLTLL